MSRAQFRAKSGALTAIEDEAKTAEIESAGLAGRVQVKALGARSKSVF